MNSLALEHNVWTTLCEQSGSPVDNSLLSTDGLTTNLQDVTSGQVACEAATVDVIGKHTLYPQSTGLITVISSSYKHPHLMMNNTNTPAQHTEDQQGARYEI